MTTKESKTTDGQKNLPPLNDTSKKIAPPPLRDASKTFRPTLWPKKLCVQNASKTRKKCILTLKGRRPRRRFVQNRTGPVQGPYRPCAGPVQVLYGSCTGSEYKVIILFKLKWPISRLIRGLERSFYLQNVVNIVWNTFYAFKIMSKRCIIT